MRRRSSRTREQMRLMAAAGRITERALAAAKAAAVPGATTADLDAAAEAVIRGAGATPNFLGYYGFPATVCASVNEEVVHGIPGTRVLEPGDVVSVDCGCIVDGWHSDSAITFVVGEPLAQRDVELIDAAERALWAGIAAFATATRISEISRAIFDVSEKAGFHPLEGYVGHGIGTEMHMAPEVPNYPVGSAGAKVGPGMCLAIEPMLVIGTSDSVTLDDDWTVVSADGSRSSHAEHSVARHEDGIWVLTAADGGAKHLASFGIEPVAP